VTFIHGREQGQSNLQVIEQLTADLVQTALKALDNTEGQALILRSSVPAKGGVWLIEKQIVAWARENGITAVFQADSLVNPHVQGLRIEYLPIEMKVSYQGGDTLAEGRTARSASVAFYMKATTADHRIVFAEQFAKSKTDTIRTSEMQQLDNSLFAFAHAEKNRRSFFSTIVEPLIITIATGGVIYIFYTFRSK